MVQFASGGRRGYRAGVTARSTDRYSTRTYILAGLVVVACGVLYGDVLAWFAFNLIRALS